MLDLTITARRMSIMDEIIAIKEEDETPGTRVVDCFRSYCINS